MNQHVGGPLPIPAPPQYYATSAGSSIASTTGGAYHASSGEFPGISVNMISLATFFMLACSNISYKVSHGNIPLCRKEREISV